MLETGNRSTSGSRLWWCKIEPRRKVRAELGFFQEAFEAKERDFVVAVADPNFAGARGEVQGAFLVDLGACVAGREDFNADVRSSYKSIVLFVLRPAAGRTQATLIP